MRVDRRTFLLLSATALAGCAVSGPGAGAAAGRDRKVVNAGPASLYLVDGVYTRFRDAGFFIVRRGPELFALSSICTHKRCKLIAEPDHTFICPCHGSTFDPDGQATKGPARRRLPAWPVATSEAGNLLVTLGPT